MPPYYSRAKYGGKGVMDVRNSSDVPRAASHGAREETEPVTDEVGDDHFDDL